MRTTIVTLALTALMLGCEAPPATSVSGTSTVEQAGLPATTGPTEVDLLAKVGPLVGKWRLMHSRCYNVDTAPQQGIFTYLTISTTEIVKSVSGLCSDGSTREVERNAYALDYYASGGYFVNQYTTRTPIGYTPTVNGCPTGYTPSIGPTTTRALWPTTDEWGHKYLGVRDGTTCAGGYFVYQTYHKVD